MSAQKDAGSEQKHYYILVFRETMRSKIIRATRCALMPESIYIYVYGMGNGDVVRFFYFIRELIKEEKHNNIRFDNAYLFCIYRGAHRRRHRHRHRRHVVLIQKDRTVIYNVIIIVNSNQMNTIIINLKQANAIITDLSR